MDEQKLLNAIDSMLKTGLEEVRQEMKAEMSNFQTEMKATISGIKNEISDFKSEMKAEMSDFKKGALEHSAEVNKSVHDVMQNDIAHIKGDLEGTKQKLLTLEAVTADNWKEITALKLAE